MSYPGGHWPHPSSGAESADAFDERDEPEP